MTLFFVLSGFILTYNYAGLTTRSEVLKFYASRFARIYPVMVLALTLGAFGVAYALMNRGSGALRDWYALEDSNALNLWGSFVAQLTVFTGWLPVAGLNQPWNSPAWSISCEVFFYLLFPLLIVQMRKLKRIRMVVLLLASFAAQCLVIFVAAKFAPSGERGYLVYQFPVTHLFEFMAGIVAGLFFLRGGNEWIRQGRRRGALLGAALMALAVLAFFRPVNPAFLLMSPLFAVLILALAARPRRRVSFLAWGPLILLGEASFSLYMIHVPLMNLLSVIPPRDPRIGWLLVAVVVLLSILVFKRFETPARFRVRAAVLGLIRASLTGTPGQAPNMRGRPGPDPSDSVQRCGANAKISSQRGRLFRRDRTG